MPKNNRQDPRQMPLRMLFSLVGTVRVTGVKVDPDGTLYAINATMEGNPAECVEFVRQATGTDDAVVEVETNEARQLPESAGASK